MIKISKKLTVSILVLVICVLFFIPIIVTNIDEKINSEKEVKVVKEITQAIEQMSKNGMSSKLETYSNTDAFVDDLQKYLKITKRCDAEHISECWPTKTITDNTGIKHNISDITTSDQMHLLHFNTGKNMNVGIVLSDGTSVILSYDVKRKVLEDSNIDYSIKTLPIGWGKTHDYSYTSSATKYLDFIADVNGAKGPNRETTYKKAGDIRSFKNTRIGSDCPDLIFSKGKKITGLCLVDIGKDYSPIDCSPENNDPLNKILCGDKRSSGFKEDYWAGAKKACIDLNLEIPTISNLHDISTFDDKKYENLQKSGWYWSINPSSKFPKTVGRIIDFSNGYVRYHEKDVKFNVICSGI